MWLRTQIHYLLLLLQHAGSSHIVCIMLHFFGLFLLDTESSFSNSNLKEEQKGLTAHQ